MPECYRTTFQRITDLGSLEGQTKKFESVFVDDEFLYVKFSDGTFLYIVTDQDGYDEYSFLDFDSRMPSPLHAVKLGLIDQEEYDRSSAENDAEIAKIHRERDYALYKTLKERFGGE